MSCCILSISRLLPQPQTGAQYYEAHHQEPQRVEIEDRGVILQIVRKGHGQDHGCETEEPAPIPIATRRIRSLRSPAASTTSPSPRKTRPNRTRQVIYSVSRSGDSTWPRSFSSGSPAVLRAPQAP